MTNFNLHGLGKSIVLAVGVLSSMSAAAWKVELNFNNGTVGAKAQGGVGGFSDAAGKTYYTKEQSYEGGQAVEMNVEAGCTCYGTWGGVINHPEQLVKGDEVWFRVRTFMPIGFNWNSSGEGSHLKFLRVHTQSPSGSNEGYNDWYINPSTTSSNVSHKFIFEGEQVWDNFADKSKLPVLGKWETYEMYLKLDNVSVASGGQARVRVWKDGVLLKDITNRRTLRSATSVSDRTHLFTYWNGGAPKTQKMFVDDVVLTSDVPNQRDAQGNPFIGADGAADEPQSVPAPSAPTLEVL